MNILLIGKPGSGKGTITKNIIKNNDNFIHLSTGDLLRSEVESGSELGKEIKNLIKDGNFVSDELIIEIVKSFIGKNKDKNIIFDGFPRNEAQVEICEKNNIKFDYIFNLKVDDEIIKQRIVNRRVHIPSGRVYNILTSPPKVDNLDDITNEPLTHRDDDKLDILEKRLNIYKNVTEPIIEKLQKNYIVYDLDGEGDNNSLLSKIDKIINVKFKNKF